MGKWLDRQRRHIFLYRGNYAAITGLLLGIALTVFIRGGQDWIPLAGVFAGLALLQGLAIFWSLYGFRNTAIRLWERGKLFLLTRRGKAFLATLKLSAFLAPFVLAPLVLVGWATGLIILGAFALIVRAIFKQGARFNEKQSL
jgi:hypothetical protein